MDPEAAQVPAAEEAPLADEEIPDIANEEAIAAWARAIKSAEAMEVEVPENIKTFSATGLTKREKFNIVTISARVESLNFAWNDVNSEIVTRGLVGPPRAKLQMDASALVGETRRLFNDLGKLAKPFAGE